MKVGNQESIPNLGESINSRIDPLEPEKKTPRAIMIVVPLLFLVLLAVILAQLFMNKKSDSPTINNPVSALVSPTPMPFEEMTIPYLRNKSFDATLSSLEEVGSNGNYNSYVASYQSDGNKINGLLTIPTGEEPEGGWPAIVFVHGYIPPTSYATQGQAYSSYVDYLARNGFVVYKIDLRGHGESEGEPSGGYYSEGYIIDTLNAYHALETTDFVNPEKIGLWGHSMAGNVILRAIVAKPSIPVAVVWGGAGFTYADLQEYRINDTSYRPPTQATNTQRKRDQLFEKYGTFNPDSSFWKLVTPINFLSDVKTAIQLNHAVDDSVVNVEYSRNLNKILDETSISHELKEYYSGGHNIEGTNFTNAMENTVRYYKKYLQ